MKILYFGLLLLSAVFHGACKKPDSIKHTVDLAPVAELILYDRESVTGYQQDLRQLLQQHDSVEIQSLGLTAHVFYWGGETGGPWNRVLSFCRDTGDFFQRNFFYDGEYKMSGMTFNIGSIKDGTDVSLGRQLTYLARETGPAIYLDRNKMQDLLVCVMEKLLHCPRITENNINSLKMNTESGINNPDAGKELRKSFENIKRELTEIKDPNVLFFQGELTNGIWKGTIRQYDHTGRYCIELDYLNGKYAFTFWL